MVCMYINICNIFKKNQQTRLNLISPMKQKVLLKKLEFRFHLLTVKELVGSEIN